jgi:bifunctional DNA-binding transcriptional regulator/antitoxin component of YhaV-PrlF toxin-antitoxin module
MRAQIGLRRGEKIVARVEDGAVILEPVDAAIRRAQALVAQYVPKNVDLVQELIDERRQAAMDE